MTSSHRQTIEEQREFGKSLRGRAPRASHAEWSPPPARPNPIGLPGEDLFRDVSRHLEAKRYPGLLIVRFENSLFYANANHCADQVKLRIEESPQLVREVLVDCQTMNLIDTTAAGALIGLSDELRKKGIRFSLISRGH